MVPAPGVIGREESSTVLSLILSAVSENESGWFGYDREKLLFHRAGPNSNEKSHIKRELKERNLQR